MVVILIAAFLLRLIGTVPGHNPYHPDEPMSYSSALEMVTHDDLNPRRFDYPAGVPLLHYGVYRTFIFPPLLLAKYWNTPGNIFDAAISGGSFFTQRSNELFASGAVIMLFVSRIVTALLGVSTVYLVYVIGRKLFYPTVGLSAAFILAVNYRHVLSSHLALSDVPNAFFAALAFVATIFLSEKQTRGRYLLAGVLVGLAVSMKYQVFTVLPLLFTQLVWSIRKKSLAELINSNFILALLLIPLVFILLNPYLFSDLSKHVEQISIVSRRYGYGANRLNFYPLYYLYHWGLSQFPFFAIILGFLAALVRRPLLTLALLSFIGPFLYIFLFYLTGGTYVRNFTTVLPFVVILGGYAIAESVRLLQQVFNRQFALLSFTILVIMINSKPLGDSITLAVTYLKPWNRETLIQWSENNLPAASRIINANVALPTSLAKPMTIDQWEHKEINSITELMEKRYDFAALNVSWYQIYLFWFDLPWSKLKDAGGIPTELLRDSYYGHALEEMKQYAVKEIYKPWQAPDDNYLVLKIPRVPNKSPVSSQRFTLSADTESLHIPVEEGRLYRIEAFVKNSSMIESNRRDAFLRVDFYRGGNGKPITTAVSGRLFGAPGLHRLTIYATAPAGVSSVVVGLERSRPQDEEGYEVVSSTVSHYEKPLSDPYPEIPYISSTIPKDVLYPIGIY